MDALETAQKRIESGKYLTSDSPIVLARVDRTESRDFRKPY
jgi:hypothetical protein